MTNEQKADRLEEMAFDAGYRDQESDAALLREAAAMMRERGVLGVQWGTEGGATKNGLYLWAGPCVNGFASLVQRGRRRLYLDWHPTLEAAQAAAVAWVDERQRGGISWTSEDRGHGMVLTSAVYRNRLIAIVGRSGRTFFWTVSKVAAREHEEFGTADTLESAQAAAIGWADEQEGK